MREIKFRGVTAEGKYAYGLPVRVWVAEKCNCEWYLVKDTGERTLVLENSLEQLIGWDKNDDEVYEGDRVYMTNWSARADMSFIKSVKSYRLVKCESAQ